VDSAAADVVIVSVDVVVTVVEIDPSVNAEKAMRATTVEHLARVVTQVVSAVNVETVVASEVSEEDQRRRVAHQRVRIARAEEDSRTAEDLQPRMLRPHSETVYENCSSE